LLVPPRDPAALAGGILRVLRDRQLAGDLAQAGQKRVLCAFTPEIQTATMQGVYRKVLRRS
jgi:glycosyltransferase involved in cell wall biosynthesis